MKIKVRKVSTLTTGTNYNKGVILMFSVILNNCFYFSRSVLIGMKSSYYVATNGSKIDDFASHPISLITKLETHVFPMAQFSLNFYKTLQLWKLRSSLSSS